LPFEIPNKLVLVVKFYGPDALPNTNQQKDISASIITPEGEGSIIPFCVGSPMSVPNNL